MVCVVIPVCADNPTPYELISFKQCFAILSKHPIKVIAPEGLNLNRYHAVVKDFDTFFIDPKWQANILSYNKLKLSQFFYNLFAAYDFLLTYELDAFVFNDELEAWCNKGYDYIGAPWFEGYTSPNSKLIGVGNSGFSLRKIAPVKKGVKQIQYKPAHQHILGRRKKYRYAIMSIYYALFKKFIKENITIQKTWFLFEDRVICDELPLIDKNFKIAGTSEAYRFSFETNPALLYTFNNNKLPFGCHAWWRYDLGFWKPFIENYGYSLDSE